MALWTLPYDGLMRIAPRSLWRLRPLIEIGEVKDFSLRREPSAGSSEGGLLIVIRG